MTPDADPNGGSFSDEKRQLEIQKLKLEAINLAKPWFRTSPAWLAISALAISIATNIIQYSGAERARQLAEIRKERLELEAERLETKAKLLSEDISRQLSSLDVMKTDLDNHRAQLTKLLTDIQEAKTSKADLMIQVQAARKTADQIAADARRQAANRAFVRNESEESNSVFDLFKRSPTQAMSDSTPASFPHYVQAAAFPDSSSAEQQVAKLAMIGVKSRVSRVSERTQSGKTVYRVLLGPFQSRAEAARITSSIEANGIHVDGIAVDR